MTSVWRVSPANVPSGPATSLPKHKDSDPFSVEERGVDAAHQLHQLIAKSSREFRLLMRGINYDKLTVSASPPGAISERNAHDTLTRVAQRKKAERQRAFRSGGAGLLNAIRAA